MLNLLLIRNLEYIIDNTLNDTMNKHENILFYIIFWLICGIPMLIELSWYWIRDSIRQLLS